MKPYTKGFVSAGNVCQKTFMDVLKIQIPVLPFYPIKPSINPDTKPEFVPVCVVLFANKGIVNISQTVVMIEGYQKTSISYGNLAACFLFFYNLFKKAMKSCINHIPENAPI